MQVAGKVRLDEYRAVRNAVEAVLDVSLPLFNPTLIRNVAQAKRIPENAAPECMELMTGLIHPYNLTYVRCCQVFSGH